MADNDPSIYDSREQLDFARRMAESLLKSGQNGYIPDAAMAKLPGTWMYGVPNIIKAISGAQYRDVAGDRENKLIGQQSGKPVIPAQRYGARASQPVPQAGLNDPSRTLGTPKIGMEQDDPEGRTGSVKLTADSPGDDFINKLIHIESGWNPNAKTGSYRGYGQFGKAEEQRYGINDTNWNKPEVAIPAVKQHMAWLHPQLEEKLGRSPTPGELYLAHQQGASGGPALLNNPNEPAWKAVRPYYKDDATAKLAISGNIPKGNYLKQLPIDEVKAGDFAKLWTSKFDDTPSTSGDKFAGRMGLGGPQILGAEGAQQPTAQPLGDQVAQAGGPNAPVPTTNPQVSPPQNIPGYGIPPANPVLTQDQLDATLRMAPAAERPKILEDYRKSKIGEDIETPFGKTRVTPPGQPGEQPTVTNMPSKLIPLGLPGINLNMIPKPDGTVDLLLPGGETKGFKSVSELLEYARQEQAKTTDLEARTGDRAKRYEADQAHAEANYRAVRDRGDQLKLATQIANDPTFISGSAQQRRELISKFFQTVGMQPPGEGADLTQAFVKIISGNILEDIKGLGGQGLGQIRAKEMEIIEKMNAMPDMSPGAIRAVVNLTNKMNQRVQDYQDKLLDYSAEHGKIDPNFYQQMRKFYNKEENHFMSVEEMQNYRKMFENPNKKKEEWETLPSGAKRRKIE